MVQRDCGDDLNSCLARADQARYAANRAGRNRVVGVQQSPACRTVTPDDDFASPPQPSVAVAKQRCQQRSDIPNLPQGIAHSHPTRRGRDRGSLQSEMPSLLGRIAPMRGRARGAVEKEFNDDVRGLFRCQLLGHGQHECPTQQSLVHRK